MIHARSSMVADQLLGRDIRDERVLQAMATVPRERFVPAELRSAAYADSPLPIGRDQTISQPYVVALMTQALALKPGDRVLEIGTGSGYQAAVLSELGAEVWSIEIVPELAAQAEEALVAAGYPVGQGGHIPPAEHPRRGYLHLRTGDGYVGWPEAGPFDGVILTAAPEQLPPPLLDQLAPGGRLIAPLGGEEAQELVLVTRGPDGLDAKRLLPVRFVPMTGEAAAR